jgi:hypothetical protein
MVILDTHTVITVDMCMAAIRTVFNLKQG